MVKLSTEEGFLERVSANWSAVLIRGLLLIAIGLYALINPGLSLLAWSLVIGYLLLIDGIFAIVAAIAGWTEARGWAIVRGIVTVAVALFAILRPEVFGVISGLTVVLTLAIWSMAGGVMEIIVAIRDRKQIKGEGWMILNGLFSVLFGVVLVLAPLLSLAVFIQISGAFAIIAGGIALYTAFKLRKLRKSR